MFIEYKAVRLSNFLSYGKTPTEIILNAAPRTLLLGDFGSGKSAIPNAIDFCLFDDSFRNVQKAQVVNSINGKNCVVEVDFRIGADEYTVRRGVKPNIFDIIKNGNPLPKDSNSRNFQKELETNILRHNQKVHSQIVSIGEFNFVGFMRLPAAERRAFVEKALSLEIFSLMNVVLKTRIKETQEIVNSLNSEVSSLENEILIHEQYIQKARQENKEKLKELDAEIKGFEAEIKKHQEAKTKIEAELIPLVELKEQVAAYDSQINDIDFKIKQLDITVQREERKKTTLQEDHVCPTCNRELPKDPEAIAEQIKAIDDTLGNLARQREKGTSKRSELVQARDDLGYDESLIEEIQGRITQETMQIRGLKDKITFRENEKPKYSAQATNVKEIEKEIKTITKQVDGKKAELAVLVRKRNVQDVSLSLLKDDGVKAEIIRNYMPKVNLYMNKFLQNMGMDVAFHLNEEFEETITTKGKESYTYYSFSSGQRQIIDLALLLTWRSVAKSRNSVNSNLLFIDEIMDSHLNDEAAENVADMFGSDLFKGNNIFIISHKRELASKFPNTINFQMVDGFTQVS